MSLRKPKEEEIWAKYVLQIVDGPPNILDLSIEDARAQSLVKFDAFLFKNGERSPWKPGKMPGTMLIENSHLMRNPHNGYEILYDAICIHNVVGQVTHYNPINRDGTLGPEKRLRTDELLRDGYGFIAASLSPP